MRVRYRLDEAVNSPLTAAEFTYPLYSLHAVLASAGRLFLVLPGFLDEPKRARVIDQVRVSPIRASAPRAPGVLPRGPCQPACRGRYMSATSLFVERFTLYDNLMAEKVTEEQIQAWADEAEAGYDVEELKRRGRGRPGRGAEPMQVIAVRLTAEEVAAVDALAARENLSRSEAIRRALAGYAA